MSAGILCRNQVLALIDPPSGGTVRLCNSSNQQFDKRYVDESAIDVPLGNKYWEMKGSCRTGNEYKVADLTRYHALPGFPKDIACGEPVVLKRRHVYLFEADCLLDLKRTRIQGKATGRSSVGRLDVLVRLLVNESNAFDTLHEGAAPDLYIEVTPISFDLEVRRGVTLSQLRLFKGRENDISLTLEELDHEEEDCYPVLDEKFDLYKRPHTDAPESNLFPFRLDLSPDPGVGFSAFAAKCTQSLSPLNPDAKGAYDPMEYWEPMEAHNHSILLEPDRLYILRSKERLRIPGHLALECKSYTTQMGEWRIEYAGFAHPHFGSMRPDNRGTPIIFEVRGHNVPTILTDGIPLGNVRFLRMSQPAQRPSSLPSYETQELALSKCFRPWKH